MTGAHIGVLYPGYAAEDDYPLLERMLEGVRITVVHTSVGEDAHRVDALLDLGSGDRLRDGALRLREAGVDAATWGCTSGSFVFGLEGARRQAAEVGATLGVPCSSTSLAFAAALEALGVTTVGVAASYPADVTDHFVRFLSAGGVTASHVGSHDIVTAAEVGTLGREAVLELAASGDHPDAQAVLVPDTAMRTVAWVDDLEAALGKPVLTANQVTVWDALRLAGATRRVDGLGHLFRGVAPLTDGGSARRSQRPHHG